MYVRVKVRTLLLFLVVTLGLALGTYWSLPTYLLHARNYNAILRYFPASSATAEALYQSAIALAPDPQGSMTYYIFSDTTAGTAASGTPIPSSQMKLAVQKLRQFIRDYPGNFHISEAQWKLAQLERQSGDITAALQQLGQIAHSNGTYADQARQELQLFPSTRTARPGDVLSVSGAVLAGHHQLANVFVFLRSTDQENSFAAPPQNSYPGGYTNAKGEFQLYNVPPGDYDIGFAILPAQANGYFLPTSSHATIHIGKAPAAPAHYTVRFVPQVTIISPSGGQTVHGDTLTFAWDPYPSAATYKLQLVSILASHNGVTSMATPLPGSYTTTSATFSFSQLRGLLPGGSKDSADGLVPTAALGAIYPGGEFSWSVDAYDARGKLLSSSRTYYLDFQASNSPTSPHSHTPLFFTDTNGQLAGDRYLLQYDYQKAQAAYLAEQSSPYALQALGVMAFYGVHWNQAGNPKLALSYLERMKNPSADVLRLIASAKQQLAHPTKSP